MKSTFSRLQHFFLYRKLRVHIVFYFLTIFITCFIIVQIFYYHQLSRAVTKLSSETMRRFSSIVTQQTDALLHSVAGTVQISQGFIQEESSVNLDNKALIDYMFGVINYNQHLSAFYFGTPKGDFIEVVNLQVDNITWVRSQPHQNLPENAKIALRVISEETGGKVSTWYYYDSNYQLVFQDLPEEGKYNPRVRPWYLGAVKEKKLYWTDFYIYDESKKPGMTCAFPIYDREGALICVVGGDLSFTTFYSFLQQVQIEKTGRVFIVDQEGQLLLPNRSQLESYSSFSSSFLHNMFVKTKKKMELNEEYIEEVGGIKYLSYLDSMQSLIGKNWYILIIAPFNEVFRHFIAAEKNMAAIMIVIFLLIICLTIITSRRISRPIVTLTKEIDRLTHLDLKSELRVKSFIYEIFLMDRSIYAMKMSLRSFAKYVPRKLVKGLVAGGKDATLGGSWEHVVVLFSDIENFTSFVENCDTQILTDILSDYFQLMTRAVQSEQGTIDKYIGDSLMAFWNAPEKIKEPEFYAARAALRMQRRHSDFNQRMQEKGFSPFHTRIGVHSGKIFVGNIGTKERLNYTVMGDNVNTASRLEMLNKEYKTNIIISEEMQKKIANKALTRCLGLAEMRGKKDKIFVYELMGMIDGDEEIRPTQDQKELCDTFTEACKLFEHHQAADAAALCKQILEKFPDDLPTKMLLDRIKIS